MGGLKEDGWFCSVELKERLKEKYEELVKFCTDDRGEERFFEVEKGIRALLWQMGVLALQLYRCSYQERFA